ncbi:MAG: hypothetical protein IJJ71_00740, partial [Treponema sp.]|uniref:hypothetical protein n=1 Tax=Treponema sp. TaxID=166 RepID=UPI0025D29B05
MCLILTICTAVGFSVAYLSGKKNGTENKSVFTAMLMFWAASLMLSMDGVASVVEGVGFFDISVEDTIIGAIIVASGMFV